MQERDTRTSASPFAGTPKQIAVFAVAFTAAVVLGNLLHYSPQDVATFWPASGVLLGTLLLTQRATWWRFLVAAVAVQVVVDLGILAWGGTLQASELAWRPVAGLANCAEGWIGATLLQRLRGLPYRLDGRRAVLLLYGLAGLLSPAISAAIGAAALTATRGDISYYQVWQTWWFADALGVMIVTPVILTFAARGETHPYFGKRTLELLVGGTVFFVVAHLVFGSEPRPLLVLVQLPYICIPALMWLALRHGPLATASAILVLAILVAVHADREVGPFVPLGRTVHENVLAMQAFLTATAVSLFLLSAVGAERREAEARLEASAVELAAEVRERRRVESDRDEVELQLRQAQKMEAVGRLAGAVAHDFNNLLTVIQGYSELSLQDIGDQQPTREHLEQVVLASRRAAKLTSQLLAFSRKRPLRPEVVDVGSLLRELEKMLVRLIGEHIELDVQSCDEGHLVLADPAQLEQVLMNLVVNARDAMPDGGRISITEELVQNPDARELAAGPHVRIVVADNGQGIAKEIQPKVFDPFFTTKGLQEGTGLGLSTVYGVVRQCGGTVSFDSAPGTGTRFEIFLPLTSETGTSAPEAAAAPTEDRALHDVVLVVEDESALRSFLVTVLREAGYQVLEADTGTRALELATQNAGSLDLVLADVVLPAMSGPELERQVRKLRPGLPFIFLSGYPEKLGLKELTLPAGVPLLQKPFGANELLAQVAAALAHA